MTQINTEKFSYLVDIERDNVAHAVQSMIGDLNRLRSRIDELEDELKRAVTAARDEDEEPRVSEKIIGRQADYVSERLSAVRHTLNNVNRYEGQFASAMARVAGLHAMHRLVSR